MLSQLRRALLLPLVALVLFGLGYPLVGTGVSQLFFSHQANGSLTRNGSTLIGQPWSGPQWFHGRPNPYDPLALNGVAGTSGAANLGPRSQELVTQTRKLIAAWRRLGINPTPDLVTTSGSGLDPDITPTDALVQVPVVARATGISPARLRQLIRAETISPELGFLGPAYIDVLQLNGALARLR